MYTRTITFCEIESSADRQTKTYDIAVSHETAMSDFHIISKYIKLLFNLPACLACLLIF